MKKNIIVMMLSALMLTVWAVPSFGQATRPSELKYPALKFDPPDPAASRVEFAGGLRGYVQEDNSLPMVNLTALVNFGSLYEPEAKAGLADLLGSTLIKGGTKTMSGPDIEERIDFLGGRLSFYVGERTAQLSLNVLSKDLDEGLALFFDVLRNPEFRDDAVKLARSRMVEELRQVNDAPSAVLAREFERLLYGRHPLTVQPTKATCEALTSADLKELHARYFTPGNIILAASGDFTRAGLKGKIEKAAAGWKNGKVVFPVISHKFPVVEPGVYFVQKATNQGYISIGHLGIEDTDPDYFAVQIMNFVLGGGGFSSRITKKVRSDEGLSYNQGSRFSYRWGFPGTFSGYVQTKSSTVGYAVSLIKKEFDRIRTEPISDAELATAINFSLESFADFFTTPQATMANFANLEMTGKPMDYYKTYRDKVKAVTKARVLEAARKYVRPESMALMIVGDFEPCNKGGEKWAGPLDKFGKMHKVALFDPFTGKQAN